MARPTASRLQRPAPGDGTGEPTPQSDEPMPDEGQGPEGDNEASEPLSPEMIKAGVACMKRLKNATPAKMVEAIYRAMETAEGPEADDQPGSDRERELSQMSAEDLDQFVGGGFDKELEQIQRGKKRGR